MYPRIVYRPSSLRVAFVERNHHPPVLYQWCVDDFNTKFSPATENQSQKAFSKIRKNLVNLRRAKGALRILDDILQTNSVDR